jgi:hypothetical protein
MSTTDDVANEATARQGARRRVHIVPHTHWDRQCSGAVSSRSNAAETWSAATHTNGCLPSRRGWFRGAEDWLRTGATRSQPDSSFMAVLDVVRHHRACGGPRSSCGTRDYVVRWPDAVPLAMSTEHYARHITPLPG